MTSHIELLWAMQVCPVEGEWVGKYVEKLRGVDVERLSGGASTAHVLAAPAPASVGPPLDNPASSPLVSPGRSRHDQAAVDAAKARFAARKAARVK